MIVRDALLKLAQVVDPVSKDGVEFTASTVCTMGGQRFTAQRLLDIYNMSRVTLLSASRELYAGTLKNSVGGAVVSATVKWTVRTEYVFADKPSGFMFLISMSKADNTPIIVLGPSMIDVVRSGKNPQYTQSDTRSFAFEVGNQYRHYGTFIANDAVHNIVYWGIADWTLANAVLSTTVETINDSHYPKLIDIGAAIARGAGSAEALSLAKLLLGAQN